MRHFHGVEIIAAFGDELDNLAALLTEFLERFGERGVAARGAHKFRSRAFARAIGAEAQEILLAICRAKRSARSAALGDPHVHALLGGHYVFCTFQDGPAFSARFSAR